MTLLRGFFLRCSTNPWLARRLPRLRFVRRAVRRFMPGEEPEDALREAEALQSSGARTLLTLLGENVADEEEARSVVDEYAGLLEAIAGRGLDAEISVKPTHLGLDLGEEVAVSGIRRLAAAAEERGTWVWIDMEGSDYTDPTLALYRRVRERHEKVGICLQAYLHRTPGDLEALLPLRPGIRLVKGAYAEPPHVALARKADVDRAFLALADRLLAASSQGGARAAFGTHDPRMIEGVAKVAASRGVNADAYEVQMLYGIGSERQRRLLEDGTRLRVLISYGPAWYPWYMRRLAERPANAWFVLRSLFRR